MHPKPQPAPWTRRDFAAAVFMLANLAACDRVPGGFADSGAQIVLQASDVHVLATSDSIATVEDLEVLRDGTVWLLNSAEPFFVGFDRDGNVIQAHGRLGGGPEEFSAPSGFIVGGIDGQAWVFDRQRHMMVEVSRPDSTRLEIPLPQDAIPVASLVPGIRLGWSNVVRTARLGDELILPRRSNPPEAGVRSLWLAAWTADIVAMEPETDSVRNVIALAETLGDPTPHFDLTDAFLPFPLWFRLWSVCSGTEIRVYDRLRNEVRKFTRDGVELEALALPPARHGMVTAGQYGRALFHLALIEAAPVVPSSGKIDASPADSARIMDGLMSRLKAPPDQLANLLPRYLDLRCDENGTLWMQPFDIDMGGLEGGPVWLRITSDGETNEVRVPDGFDPYRFTSERIWGVQRNELDVASVAWIAVPRAR